MNCSDNSCSSCIYDVLKQILVLQKQDCDLNDYVGCDKPFLGPTIQNNCYNTRPILLYNCCTANTWSFDYTLSDGTTGSSNVLRVEALNDCCCTCRILYPSTETTGEYLSTNQFVTLDLKCCGAIRCLTDTYVDLC